MRKKLLTMRVVKPWPRLPREVVDPWKHSRPGWTGLWAPCSSWRCPCSLQGVGLGDLWRSLPSQSILWFCWCGQIPTLCLMFCQSIASSRCGCEKVTLGQKTPCFFCSLEAGAVNMSSGLLGFASSVVCVESVLW